MANTYHRDFHVHDNEVIVNATKVMKIIFAANLLWSEFIEQPKFVEKSPEIPQDMEDDDEDFSSIAYTQESSKISRASYDDVLMTELGISMFDCCEPFIPFEEFQNEVLSEAIESDEDFMRYRTLMSNDKTLAANSLKTFTFMVHSFILTPSAKTLALFFDSRVKMYTERRSTILNMHYLGGIQHPYLKVKIRRDYLIDDALAELEVVAMANPKDLKKQIFIEFDGEQGIDEGGVSKEFFQLIVEEIFNPNFGMFIFNEDTRNCWFNSFSFENEAQFTLIGIVLGLAIYNIYGCL